MSTVDPKVEKFSEWVFGRKWILFALVIIVPILAAAVNRFVGGKDFSADLGDFIELFLEMAALGGIAIYFLYSIGARTKTIEVLREGERRYRQLFDLVPDPIVIHRNGIILLVNEAAAKSLEMDGPSDLVGRSLLDFIEPGFHPVIRERLRTIEENRAPLPLQEIPFVGRNGKLVYGESRSVLSTFRGEPAIISVGRDITERLLAQEALQESERKYRLVVDNAYEGIFVIQDGMIRFFNPRVENLMEYSATELLETPFPEFIFPDDREEIVQIYFRRMGGDTSPHRHMFRVVTKSGKIIWVELDSVSITWEGRPAVLGIGTDITDRKEVEEALRESERHFRDLIEKANDIIYLTDENGHFVLFNPVGLRITGYSQEEINLKHYLDLIHPEFRKQAERFYGIQYVKKIPDTYYEVPIMTKHGEAVWIGQSVQLTMDGDRVVGFQAIGRDITRSKRAEQALRESEAQYRAVFDNAAVGINLSDRDGRFLQVNSASSHMLGYTQEELRGLTVFDVTHPDDRAVSRENFAALVQGRINFYRTEKRCVRKDHEILWTDVSVSAIRDQNGGHTATLGVLVDITDRKRVEQEKELLKLQLVQAQKMEAIGTLTGGIAHDFNNLLTIILGYAELLVLDKSEEDPECQDLEKIIQTARNAAELVQRLLVFTRKSEMKAVPVDLNDRIEQLSQFLSRTLPRMISIELHLSKDLAVISADPSQMDQVLMNLAVNAKEAMPDGGNLVIETKNVFLDEDYCRSHIGSARGRCVELTVSDTGSGMDESTMQRVFEPFFSTKARDSKKGTGLGLSMVHGIVEQHGGHITCRSELGKGTSFRIYFPELIVEQPEVESRGPVVRHGVGGTILLVDDEASVRDLGKRILELAGYRVLTARDGREALGVYATERAEISLVILDLIMPEMDGRRCLDGLLEMNPAVKVLVATGFSPDEAAKEEFASCTAGWVAKPYDMRQMLQAVDEALALERGG